MKPAPNKTIATMSIATSDNPTRSAAWYVMSPQDIDALEAIKFNLFFLNRSDYAAMSVADRNDFIQQNINALDEGSKVVLPIDNFLLENWYAPDGMEVFINTWGNNPKVYGFLLKDDVSATPFPGENNINPSALWVYRWYYHMIRNTADDQSNSYNTDLAPGKKIIVTLPFQWQDEAGNEIHNSKNAYHFPINSLYDVPPGFFMPGDSWDIVMPYWYPYRTHISAANEVYIMDTLYHEMSLAFPANAIIPIMQTAAEEPGNTYFSLEEIDDLSVQYNKFVQYGLVSSVNKTIAYYSANGHAGVYNNLLHVNYAWDVSGTNVYYREANILNAYHFSLFP